MSSARSRAAGWAFAVAAGVAGIVATVAAPFGALSEGLSADRDSVLGGRVEIGLVGTAHPGGFGEFGTSSLVLPTFDSVADALRAEAARLAGNGWQLPTPTASATVSIVSPGGTGAATIELADGALGISTDDRTVRSAHE
ncbi:hypothetical protein [Kitasatospora sp. NPDC092286]|uniref:hypothetical protein n=1 Tax=Kitasatospora sp. NPDC092286 TaxID=3364087 RepID=UPI00382D67AC